MLNDNEDLRNQVSQLKDSFGIAQDSLANAVDGNSIALIEHNSQLQAEVDGAN